MTENIVMERAMGKYRLPDEALDLETWLRDGLAVYNLFVHMRPVFWQMLEAQGGTFTASIRKDNEARGNQRMRFSDGHIGDPGEEGYDATITVTMEPGDPRPDPLAVLRDMGYRDDEIGKAIAGDSFAALAVKDAERGRAA